jgi:hypothetical protein
MMLKEAVVAYFDVISWKFSGRTEGNHEKAYQDNRSVGRDLNPKVSNAR